MRRVLLAYSSKKWYIVIDRCSISTLLLGALMTDAEKIQLLKDFQLWRLGDDKIAQPKPKDITEALDYAIRCCVRLDFIARDNPKVEVSI